MNKFSVRKILQNTKQIQLPGCIYCRTISCWNCIHFESHSPDSKGQCRCAYRGRWYYPHEGCTNGTPIDEYCQQQAQHSPPVRSTPRRNTTPSYSSNNNNRTTGGTAAGGGLAGLFFLAILVCGLFSRIESCAADIGLLKSDVTFQLTAPSTAADSNVPDGLTLVYNEGERRVYTIMFGNTHEKKRRIRKGDYEKYLLEDRMVFSYGSTYFDGVDDYTREVSEISMEDDLLNTLILTVRVKDGQSFPTDGLTVTTQAGNILPCTPYGEEDTYIVVLYDKVMSDPRETLTISAPGYQSETVKVDFQNKRICEKKVNLSKE